MIGTFLKSPAARWLVMPPLAALAYNAPDLYQSAGNVSSSTAFSLPAWTTSSAERSSTPAGQRITKEFTVQSGITLASGRMLLNDNTNFQDPNTFTVVVDTIRTKPAIADGRQAIGKKIKAQGVLASYRGKPQLLADTITFSD